MFSISFLPPCHFRIWRFGVADAIKILLSTNEDHPVRDRGRRVNRLADRVGSNHLVLRPGLDDVGVTIFTRQQQLSVECDRRRRERSGYRDASALVNYLASFSVKAG